MFKLSLFILSTCYIITNGHSGIQADADIESGLMPQELNPEFVASKDFPLQVSLTSPRLRRATDQVDYFGSSQDLANRLKRYSRIVACVVLVLSAIIEVVLYVVDLYSTP